MRIGIELFLPLAVVLVYVQALIVTKLAIDRIKRSIVQDDTDDFLRVFRNSLTGKRYDRTARISTDKYYQVKKSFRLGREHDELLRSQMEVGVDRELWTTVLGSTDKLKRIESAVYLGILGDELCRFRLQRALLTEKDYPVKVYIANSLADIGSSESLPVMVESLLNAHRWYRKKANALIGQFGHKFLDYLPNIIDSSHPEYRELIIDFASIYPAEVLRDYLAKVMETRLQESKRLKEYSESNPQVSCATCIHGREINADGLIKCQYEGQVKTDFLCRRHMKSPASFSADKNHRQLVHMAAECLLKFYPDELCIDEYLYCEDDHIRNLAVRAMGRINQTANLNHLLRLLTDEAVSRTAINTVSRIIERDGKLLTVVLKEFEGETDSHRREQLAAILAIKMDYIIMKLTSPAERPQARGIIVQILLLGKTSQFVDFANANKNLDLENELVQIVCGIIEKDQKLTAELCQYLNPRFLKKCSLEHCPIITRGAHERQDIRIAQVVSAVFFYAIVFFPLFYIATNWSRIAALTSLENLRGYIVSFNYYLIFYSLSINTIYAVLLILSLRSSKQQRLLWNLKSTAMLFKRNILPSVSIIAPAFNEEQSIVESTSSLLNLHYPDYELIVVNDGSKDRTLETLIKAFSLHRIDYVASNSLAAGAIRGVYMNRALPKLMVVDKENGGKADALNAGINVSTREYVCGIDADSLLEEDSLLKLASLTLDSGIEMPAIGGNVLPINGCEVSKGAITRLGIPRKFLPRLQTMEYIRAFMSGRLGWARLDSLLIISGAFGLFRRERLLGVGGYLTSKGEYQRDTVGEDMELVVRITRLMREKKLRFKNNYAYNANCWTEVPEDFTSLRKQRHRWHRGLLEILTFHRRLILNPKYGRVGLLAMPYFLMYEVIGPLFELQGYILVVLAAVLGLLNREIAFLLFVSTVMFGAVISSGSLLILERDRTYFSRRDKAILLAYSIVENFGPRQVLSMLRVTGLVGLFKKGQREWGQPTRRGLTGKEGGAISK